MGRKSEALKYAEASKDLKLYELALQLADQGPCEPKTLTRAARDFLESEPEFALGAALAALRWLNEGWGYEVTTVDVMDAYDLALAAADRAYIDNVLDQIQSLLNQTQGDGNAFVRQSLSRSTIRYLRGTLKPRGDRYPTMFSVNSKNFLLAAGWSMVFCGAAARNANMNAW